MAYGSEDTTPADFEENIDMATFKELTVITQFAVPGAFINTLPLLNKISI